MYEDNKSLDMRKLFYLLAAALILTGCAKSNDQMVNDKMVNDLTDYHAHAIPDSYRELVASMISSITSKARSTWSSRSNWWIPTP